MQRNRGLRFTYILSTLPRETRSIYVDAASTGGIGGWAAYSYFTTPLRLLGPHVRRCDGWSSFPRVDIALLELFADYVAIDLLAPHSPAHIITLYSDNTNVVAWLSRRRAPNPFVGAMVSAIECIKYKYLLKISARYIPSAHNVSADRLSRCTVPIRFLKHGTQLYPELSRLTNNLRISTIWSQWRNTISRVSFPS